MKFKTNAKCGGCSATILATVRALFPESRADLDLASPDKILTVSGIPEDAETAGRLAAAIAASGFQATVLEG